MEENIDEPGLYVCEASSSVYDQIIVPSSTERQLSSPVVQLSSSTASSNDDTLQSCSKKRKRLREDYETGNVSDEYDIDDDELERYLCKRLDLTNLPDNPLEFWKNNNMEFPILSKLARQICSIPASTATVERSFSASGNIVTKRRTNIEPAQLNNVLFLRSFYST